MAFHYPLHMQPAGVPQTLVRSFRVEALGPNNTWIPCLHEQNNYQRLQRYTVEIQTKALRFVPERTWGADKLHLFAWDVR